MIDFNISENVIHALSWTVIHSLWQVSIIALIMSGILAQLDTHNATSRYKVSLGALGAVLISSIVTFMVYYNPAMNANESYAISGSFMSTEIINSKSEASFLSQIIVYLNTNAHLISKLWIIGVVLFSIKFLIGYFYIQYLNYKPSLKINNNLTEKLSKLKTEMGLKRDVLIAESSKVLSPIVTGYIKPIILFPVSITSHLTTQEIEIIIAHELAHILRNDWLINLIQSVVEILFYFHPGVWWISGHIREERENCCDDIAIKYSSGSIQYAKVLVKLKEIQFEKMPSLAMSFYHSKNKLMNRISRLLGQPQNRKNIREKTIALLLVFTVAFVFANNKISKERFHIPFLNQGEDIKLERAVEIEFPKLIIIPSDTIPKRKGTSSFSFKNDNGKSYKIERKNGEITHLEIDGKEIDPQDYDEHMNELEGMDGGNFRKFDFDFGDGHGFHFDDGDMDELHEQLDKLKLHEFDFNGMEGFGEGFGSFHFGDLDSMLSHSFSFNFDDFKGFERLGEMFHGMEGLEELRDLEGLEKLKELQGLEGLEGLERLRELEGLEGMRFFDGNGDWPHMERFGSGGKVSNKIGNELNRDGLLNIDEENKIELSGKHLKINGEKQPSNIWNKYKRIWEESTGMELNEESKMIFQIEGKESRSRGLRRI